MDNKEIYDAVMDLTKQDFIDFLKASASSPDCPSCMMNAWEISDCSGGLLHLTIQKGENYTIPPISIPAMFMICQSCGFIRPHAAMSIAKWKLNKGSNNE